VRAAVEHLREDHDFFMRELVGAVNAARELAAQDGLPIASGSCKSGVEPWR
jgi:hypothetical protein